MLVNCGSVKLHAYFGREIHINVLYLPTKQKLNERWEMCLTISIDIHPCMLNLAIYSKIPKRCSNMNLKCRGKGGACACVCFGKGFGSVCGEISLSATGEMRPDKEIIK